mmetsp:Transcript_6867/g.16732  ORF Transcript_6867/g.16732 Transcript_6867/m.16732 type:complete len:279 (+) Transcript_6867:101-937(+)
MSEQGVGAAARASDNPKKNTNPHNAPGKKNKRSRHHRRNNNKGGGNTGNNKPMSEEKISRSLSWALRHQALNIGLTIKEDGYVPVQEILDSTHPKLRGATLENIQLVVQNSDKQRFKLQERPKHLYYPKQAENETEKTILCIRANQGHSISIINPESLLTKLSKDELRSLPCIVHGTYPEAWESIKSSGLKKMNRTHIHFATGLPADDGVISGMRKSCKVYIFVDAGKCASNDQIEFFISDNGVVLTDGIGGVLPTEYFSRVTGSDGNILLDNRDTIN